MQMANSQLKWLYFFDEGVTDKKLLGGKGAGLCEMTSLGLPIPPGFVITTGVCEQFYSEGQRLPPGLMSSVLAAMSSLEERTGKKFGDTGNPLLVSVRSGSPVSMPGMMDTILNLGLNDAAVEGLASITGDRRFAYDTYRRFIQLFGKIVLGVEDDEFSKLLDGEKKRRGVSQDSELDTDSVVRVLQGPSSKRGQTPPAGTCQATGAGHRSRLPKLEREAGNRVQEAVPDHTRNGSRNSCDCCDYGLR
jgi:pyruvate, orthophosphate dikinase